LPSTPDRQPLLPAYSSLFFGILSISSSPILVRWANAPGVISSFYRMGIGSLLVAVPFLRNTPPGFFRTHRKGVVFAIAGGFFFSLDMFLWSTGIKLAGATIPTLLANTAPIWVGLGALVFFQEKQILFFWLGLSIAVLGISAILAQNMAGAPNLGLGALLGLFSAFFYGGFQLSSQRGRACLDTLSYHWISTTVSAVFLFIYAILFKHPLFDYDFWTWILFLVMGIVVQLLGWMSINFAQGHIPATLVSVTLLAQPLMTAFFSIIIFKEILLAWQWVGGVLVILGVYLVHHSRGVPTTS